MRVGSFNKQVNLITNVAVIIVCVAATVLFFLYFLHSTGGMKGRLIAAGAAFTTVCVAVRYLFKMIADARHRREAHQYSRHHRSDVMIEVGPKKLIKPRLPVTIASRRGEERKS